VDGSGDIYGTTQSGGSSGDGTIDTVGPQATTTTLSTSGSPSLLGSAVTFTATVTATFGTPTGSVTFYDASTSLGSQTLTAGGGVPGLQVVT
jgi:uncharacterized repeat protein (TIGR03803 family)